MNSITYVIYGGLFFIVILLVVMLVMTAAIKKKGQNESTQQISIVRDEYMRLFAETEKDMREMKQDITNEIKSSRAEMSQNIKMSMGTLGEFTCRAARKHLTKIRTNALRNSKCSFLI